MSSPPTPIVPYVNLGSQNIEYLDGPGRQNTDCHVYTIYIGHVYYLS